MGILCIYGWSKSPERAKLWETIIHAPLPMAHWVVAGDFNNIESLSDKIGGRPTTGMQPQEQLKWHNPMLKFNIADSYHMPEFRHLTKKKFTWDNDLQGLDHIATRIDRIYFDMDLQMIGGHCGIWPTFRRISDHSPYFVRWHDWDIRTSKHLHFNRFLLECDEGRELLTKTWHDSIAADPDCSWQIRVATALKEIKQVSDDYTKNRSQKWQDTYDNEIQEILEAEEYLHEN